MGKAYEQGSFSKELNFILWLLRIEEHPRYDDREIKAICSDMDWDQFLFLAKHHRVYPTIYPSLSKLDRELIPDEVITVFHQEYRNNTFQMLHLYGEMERVCQTFAYEQVRSLMLKGPVLAEAIYGDLSMRTSKDLDILIPFQDLEKVAKILFALGYEDDDAPRILNNLRRKTHHISYTNPQRNIQIEVHWQLNPGSTNEPSFNELWERRRTGSRSSCPVYFLSEKDLFFNLVTHGTRHGWFRLRWLTDIDRMVRQGLNWCQLLPSLMRYDAAHLGSQSLILIAQLLHTPVNNEMKSIMNSSRGRQLAQMTLHIINNIVNLTDMPISEDVDKYYRGYLLSTMSMYQRWVYIIGLLYPSSYDAVTLPLPKVLHFMYFPLRPFLWLWRRLNQQDAKQDSAKMNSK
jgi:hypothetical protein